jgi:hypothetical protein
MSACLMIMSSLDLKFWRAMRSTGVRLSKVSVFTLAVRNIIWFYVFYEWFQSDVLTRFPH